MSNRSVFVFLFVLASSLAANSIWAEAEPVSRNATQVAAQNYRICIENFIRHSVIATTGTYLQRREQLNQFKTDAFTSCADAKDKMISLSMTSSGFTRQVAEHKANAVDALLDQLLEAELSKKLLNDFVRAKSN